MKLNAFKLKTMKIEQFLLIFRPKIVNNYITIKNLKLKIIYLKIKQF